MYITKLLRWTGIALTIFTLFEVYTYTSVHSHAPTFIAEDPKWGGGG